MADKRKVIAYLGAFIGPLASNAVLALIPSLKQEFMANTSAVLLSITFYMLPFAIFTLFSGAFSDVYGRKRVLFVGLAMYALGCMLTAISPDLNVFYSSRVMQGVGFALVQPVLIALLGDVAPSSEKAKSMGMFTGATTLGIALGPFVAGTIASVEWRFAFVVIASAAAILVGILVFTRNIPDSLFLTPNLSAVRSAFWTAVSDLRVIALAAAGFLHVLCYIGIQAFMSDRLSRPLILLAIAGLMGLIGARGGGEIISRTGVFKAVVIGNSIILVALMAMMTVSRIEEYVILLSVFSIGSAISWSSQLTLAIEIYSDLRGTVSSLFTSAGFLGGSIAPILLSPFYKDYDIFGVLLLIFVAIVFVLPIIYLASHHAKKM
jgi:MFS family permease